MTGKKWVGPEISEISH